MINPMKFITLAGSKQDFDRVVFRYLRHYNIHYTSAMLQFADTPGTSPFTEDSPYSDALLECKSLISYLDTNQPDLKLMEITPALHLIDSVSNQVKKYIEAIQQLKASISNIKNCLMLLEPFLTLEVNLCSLSHLKYVQFRLGRFPKEYYKRSHSVLNANKNTIFEPCHKDNEFIYGICFFPKEETDRMDSLYKSLQFEAFPYPDDYEGPPSEVHVYYQHELEQLSKQLQQQEHNLLGVLYAKRLDILSAYKTILLYENCFQLRQFAACITSESKQNELYTICGFISEQEMGHLAYDLQTDSKVFFTIESASSAKTQAPTQLKNSFIFRSFETLVHEYGLPPYHSLDPTIFLALSFALTFGIFFGDITRGLLLLLFGCILIVRGKNTLGGVFCFCGVSCSLFGLLYGQWLGQQFYLLLPAALVSTDTFPFSRLLLSFAVSLVIELVALLLLIKKKGKQTLIWTMQLNWHALAGFLLYPLWIWIFTTLLMRHTEFSNYVFLFLVIILCALHLSKPFKLPRSFISYLASDILLALLQAGLICFLPNIAQLSSTIPNLALLFLFHLSITAIQAIWVEAALFRLNYGWLFFHFQQEIGKTFTPYQISGEQL